MPSLQLQLRLMLLLRWLHLVLLILLQLPLAIGSTARHSLRNAAVPAEDVHGTAPSVDTTYCPHLSRALSLELGRGPCAGVLPHLPARAIID